MAIYVYRSGTRVADCEIQTRKNDEDVALRFWTGGPVQGSDWHVYIEPLSFKKLALAMMKVAPADATQAFASALHSRDTQRDETNLAQSQPSNGALQHL